MDKLSTTYDIWKMAAGMIIKTLAHVLVYNQQTILFTEEIKSILEIMVPIIFMLKEIHAVISYI